MDFPKSVPGVGLVGGEFVDEDASTGRQGSLIPAEWGNAVTKELLNVLQQADIEPDELDSGQVAAAILKMISEAGGMPRFTPYVWGGRGDAMPEGDTQSSGQQLLDLMYPDMRADVVATQFSCTEAEWQADPYKRVTHWSLGDGVSWMRPPDKNGVQPGNVGTFYGVGSNPAGGKTGAAVIDAMRNIKGTAFQNTFASTGTVLERGALSGPFYAELTTQKVLSLNTVAVVSGANDAPYRVGFDASLALPAGTTTDPLTGEFRPRTWYGIWMIRMYGRVVNTGLLDAPALNARMDMIDARVSSLEGRQKSIGEGQRMMDVSSSRALGAERTNSSGQSICVSIYSVGTTATAKAIAIYVDDVRFAASDGASIDDGQLFAIVPNGSSYRVNGSGVVLGTNLFWCESVAI